MLDRDGERECVCVCVCVNKEGKLRRGGQTKGGVDWCRNRELSVWLPDGSEYQGMCCAGR
jgi:hypothetical protein